MTTKPASLGIIHKILIVFVAINIVGDIGNVAFWWANPASRAASLNTGYIGVNAGVSNALTAGTVILLLVSVVYIVALYRLAKTKDVGTKTNYSNIRSQPRTCLSSLLHKPRIRVLGNLEHYTNSSILL